MVINTSMLVIDDKQCSAGPQRRISFDRHVHFRNQQLPGLHIVVRMLVACDLLSFVAGVSPAVTSFQPAPGSNAVIALAVFSVSSPRSF